ncbi:NAD-dependent epimerase/dehydratase family protein [Ktedonobacter racemifer]|uniref:NAD-dependent epimerase/dehydratase n=1 Tax=Ktedonobacter racemifer DSM 44963 TaxID=485913 RepID=D6TUZ6_KTERA|nr:NAD(P)-dependent oxidoreductase [Ktedonobacter racemifer]EFH85322.1 NAD-dependent epimerase/dehydratase [Ktedonobacter racemifer DSM 44963]
MKIFLVGATGVIGRRLIPLLVESGHEVIGTMRVAEKRQLLEQSGASSAVVDVFDRENVFTSVREAQPDVIIHQLTDLSERNLVANSRIRQEGTRNLVDAAKEAGVRHLIAQSIAWAYAPGEGPADESVPLDIEAPEPRLTTIKGVQALESAVGELERGVVLRYGLLYGPGTWYAPDGTIAEQVRRGQLVADSGVVSFLHVDDAAHAALLALNWPQGIFNIVDDEPAPATIWLPVYAATLGASAPTVSTQCPRAARGATNTRARRLLNWQPLYPSWREGFARAAREWSSQA